MKHVLCSLQPDTGAGKGKSGKVSATPGVSLCSCTSHHPIHDDDDDNDDDNKDGDDDDCDGDSGSDDKCTVFTALICCSLRPSLWTLMARCSSLPPSPVWWMCGGGRRRSSQTGSL